VSRTFVGRGEELARAHTLLERLRDGGSGCLVVLGEPGVGKSRLLEEIRCLAVDAGVQTARAACLPLRTPLPFEPVLELLRGVGSQLSDEFAETPGGVELFTSAVAAFERAGAQRPLLLVIDDLQFSDLATIELVHYCVARLSDLPIAWLVASRRDAGVNPLVHHLVREQLAELAQLSPFSAAELGELLADILGGEQASEQLVTAIRARTGGNAFLSMELARSLRDLGRLIPGDRGLEVPESGDAIPPNVVTAVLSRLARLPASARDVLAWAAILPEPIEVAWLDAVAPTVDADRDLRRLELASFVTRGSGGDWRFLHGIVRDVVYQSLTERERVDRHSTVADFLAVTHHAQLAPQLAAAGRAFEAAKAYLGLAEEALARGGAGDAASLYERARELAEEAGADQLRRRAAAGSVFALLRSGQQEEGKAVARRLLAELRSGRSDERLRFLSRYAMALWEDVSDLDGARSAAEEAAPLVGRARGRLLAEAALAQATIRDRGGDPRAARPFAEQALAAARRRRDRMLETRSLRRLGLVVGQTESFVEGISLLGEAVAVALEADLPAEAAGAYLTLSHLCHMRGDEEGHAENARRGLALHHVPTALQGLLLHNLAGACLMQGRLDEGLAHAQQAHAIAARVGPEVEARIGIILAYAYRLIGDLARARHLLDDLPFPTGSWEWLRGTLIRAEVAEDAGLPGEALEAYLLVRDSSDRSLALTGSAGCVRTALAVGDADTARSCLEHLERLAPGSSDDRWLVDASRACHAQAEGRAEEAAALFASAAPAAPNVYETTRLQFEAARLQRDRDGMRAAIEAFDEMGARGAADRARAAARSLGMRPGRRHRRDGGLTGREHDVARLAASGKTNAEIAATLYLSVRTVERHMGSILGKLGCRSRVDLAAAVSGGGLPELAGRHDRRP
jgi:DNA-binding NarL/FixJ family response regulator